MFCNYFQCFIYYYFYIYGRRSVVMRGSRDNPFQKPKQNQKPKTPDKVRASFWFDYLRFQSQFSVPWGYCITFQGRISHFGSDKK